MTLKIGGGFYAGSQIQSVRDSGAKTLLLMPLEVCQFVADEFVGQPGYACILRGDHGTDSEQYDESRPPRDEARRYINRFVAPAVARWPRWAAICGPNEWFRRLDDTPEHPVDQPHLRYRAELESALCDIIQNEMHIPYLWGGIPIGNLEARDIPIFEQVIMKARGQSAHLYLGPWRRSVADETDDWYMNRALRIWLPAIKNLPSVRANPNWQYRLCGTEIGTYYPPRETGLTMEQYARVCVDIARKLEADCAAADRAWKAEPGGTGHGVEFLGAFPFAFGAVGTMDGWNNEHTSRDERKSWRMDGTEAIISASDPSLISFGGDSVPIVGTGFQKCAPLIGTFVESEVYHFAGTPRETSMAVAEHGYATWRKATNETIAHCDDGRILSDFGNRGDGSGRMIQVYPKV